MRYIFIVCLLAGCATATPIKTGTGPGEYFISCDGSAVPWSKCFEKANQMCSNGYDMLDQATENGGFPITTQFKHLRIRCK